MKHLIKILIFISFLQACKSYKSNSQELEIIEQTPTHILIDGGSYYSRQGVILLDTLNGANLRWLNNKANYIPSFEQIITIEKHIRNKYSNLYKNYYRQYYGFVNKQSDTIIETLFIEKEYVDNNKSWKDVIYQVSLYDGKIDSFLLRLKRLFSVHRKRKLDYLLHNSFVKEVE